MKKIITYLLTNIFILSTFFSCNIQPEIPSPINNSKEKIKEIIETDSIDFIAIGGGLPDDEREEMVDYISTINSSISVHQIPRNEEAMGPYNFIPFLNNLAIMFKVRKAMEE